MTKPKKVNRVRPPKPATLRRYGLTLVEWHLMLQRQRRVCGVCARVPENGCLHIDHEHVKGWKKQKPEQRKLAVRGLICPFCNHYIVGRFMTVERATNVLAYLNAYERRKK